MYWSSEMVDTRHFKLSRRKENKGKSHGWEDNRSPPTSLQKCNWQPQSVHLWAQSLYPPSPWCEWCVKVSHTTRVYIPYPFQTVMWVFLRCCEMGPTVFHPYPRRVESLTVCRSHYKGNTFFLLLKTLSAGLARVSTCDLPLSWLVLSQMS